MMICRSPLGLRGLKYEQYGQTRDADKSQPTRAAWIEMIIFFVSIFMVNSRSPLGLRGLKSVLLSPAGERPNVAAHSGCVD